MHGESIWYAVVSVGILSDSSVECGSASCLLVVMLGRQGGGGMLETLGRPSITLVMRVMTAGVHLLTLVMGVVLLSTGLNA